jgi:hypothetical protein
MTPAEQRETFISVVFDDASAVPDGAANQAMS